MALFARHAQNKVNLPHFPDALLRTTICPFLRLTMWGRTALVNEIVPRTLTFMTDRSTSRSVSNDKPSCKMPALFTRKSICNEKEHNTTLTFNTLIHVYVNTVQCVEVLSSYCYSIQVRFVTYLVLKFQVKCCLDLYTISFLVNYANKASSPMLCIKIK